MSKHKTIRFKLNLFILTLIISLTFISTVLTMGIFLTVYDSDMRKRMDSAVDSLYETVVTSNQNSLSKLLVNLQDEMKSMGNLSVSLQDNTIRNYIQSRIDPNVLYISLVNKGVKVYGFNSYSYNMKDSYTPSLDDEVRYGTISDTEQGLILQGTAPVRSGDKVTGEIMVRIKIASQDDLNQIRKVSGFDATIFSGNVRYLTTLKSDKNYAVGTTMSHEVEAQVLSKGQVYSGKAEVLGKNYLTIYRPVFNMEGKATGAVFIGSSVDTSNAMMYRTGILVTGVAILVFLFFFLYSKHWLSRFVGVPITWITREMQRITEQDAETEKYPMPKANTREMEILEESMKTMSERIFDWKSRLETIAFTDQLTGLKNREFLYDKYSELNAADKDTVSVLLFLDVDNMKNINHIYGNKVGDQLILQITKTLGFLAEVAGYELFRVAGDEFVFCKRGYYVLEDVHGLSRSIVNNMDVPFEVAGFNIAATVSLGVAYTNYCDGTECEVCDGHCKDNLEALFKKAEIAMNSVKFSGKNNYRIFDPQMEGDVKEKTILQQQLKRALARDELMMYYQPKFSLRTNSFDGFEALIRWKHPEKGFIPPSVFIPVAEEFGLITELGYWVLETSCIFIRNFNERFHKQFKVAVNVSAIQLLGEGFEENVLEVLHKTHTEPANLELEITESVLINSLDQANVVLQNLMNNGISIALDDFGTGFSSLTYLRRLPITTLKMDKSFVDDIVVNSMAYKVFSNVVQLGKSIGLDIVVEGVEDENQYTLLKKLDCDHIQGYYFSRPLPEDSVYQLFE